MQSTLLLDGFGSLPVKQKHKVFFLALTEID
jgi:hypothetical protein